MANEGGRRWKAVELCGLLSGLWTLRYLPGWGITRNDNGMGLKVVGMDGQTQLFERCPVCDGTGMLRTSTHD